MRKHADTVMHAVSADAAVRARPRLFIIAVNFGALPFIAIDRRMRPVEYSPALRLENAAVSTTMFMIVARAVDADAWRRT